MQESIIWTTAKKSQPKLLRGGDAAALFFSIMLCLTRPTVIAWISLQVLWGFGWALTVSPTTLTFVSDTGATGRQNVIGLCSRTFVIFFHPLWQVPGSFVKVVLTKFLLLAVNWPNLEKSHKRKLHCWRRSFLYGNNLVKNAWSSKMLIDAKMYQMCKLPVSEL